MVYVQFCPDFVVGSGDVRGYDGCGGGRTRCVNIWGLALGLIVVVVVVVVGISVKIKINNFFSIILLFDFNGTQLLGKPNSKLRVCKIYNQLENHLVLVMI